MLNGINHQVASGYPVYATRQSNKISSSVMESSTRSQATANKGAEVEISEEGKMAFRLWSSEEDLLSGLNTSAFNCKETREEQKREVDRLLQEKLQDPTRAIFNFDEHSLGGFVVKALEGKAEKAGFVANELQRMISGTLFNNDASLEERAMNREIGLKNAEYLAENYFDNPDEAKAFLDEVYRFAENDILREKGYIVFENSDMKPFRNYESPLDGQISWNAYAEVAGIKLEDVMNKPQEFFKLLNTNNNRSKWSEEIVKNFEENEKQVDDIISGIRSSLSESTVNSSLQRILKGF